MAVYAELFDGTRLEFPDGTDPSVISATAKRVTATLSAKQQPDASGAVPDELGRYDAAKQPGSRRPEDVSALERNIAAGKRGFESLEDVTGGLGLAGTALTGTEAETAAKMRDIKRRQAIPQETPGLTAGDIERIYKEKGLGAAASQVPSYISESILASAPQMAIPLAAGTTATAIASPLGPAAPVVGALVGIGTYGVQQFGNFLTRQAQEKNDPKELEIAKAAMTAGATAPLGYFADKFTAGLGGLGAKKAGAEILKELSARQVAAKVGKRTVVGATEGVIAEAPLEVLEQAAERYQAGLSLTGDDAANEYKEAFFGAAGAGAGIGGASRGIQAYQKPVKPGESPVSIKPEDIQEKQQPSAAPSMTAPVSESQDTQAMIDEIQGKPAAPSVTPPVEGQPANVPPGGAEGQYDFQGGAAAVNNLSKLLQNAQQGYQAALNNPNEVARAKTFKQVKDFLTSQFSNFLDKNQTKEYVNYLIDEGGIASEDLGTNHGLFGEAVNNFFPKQKPEAVAEPVTAPAVEPVVEPIAETPPIEPIQEEPAVQPVVEPVVEPTVEQAPEPVVEPVVEPVAEQEQVTAPEPVAEPEKITAPASQWANVETGKPVTVPMYQGRGEDKSKIYNGAQVPVAGDGQYFATTGVDAANYGSVNKHNVTLNNPLVIKTDAEWRDLTKGKAGWRFPNPFGLSETETNQAAKSLKEAVMAQGYDSLVIKPSMQGDDAKTLWNVFGHDQAVVYTKPKEKSKVKAKAEPKAKPVKEPVKPEPKSFEISKSKKEIHEEIKNLDSEGVCKWLINNAPNSAAKHIAEKLLEKVKQYNKYGVPVKVEVLSGRQRHSDAAGTQQPILESGRIKYFAIKINGLDRNGNADAYTGTDYVTLMHELVHSVGSLQLFIVKRRDYKGEYRQIYKDFSSIRKALEKRVNEEIGKPSGQRHPAINRIKAFMDINSLKVVNGKVEFNYGPSTFDEIMAYGFTDSTFQDFLSSIKIGNKTALTKLVEIVRKLIGIDAQYETALDRLMTSTEKMFAHTPQDINKILGHYNWKFGPGETNQEVTATKSKIEEKAEAVATAPGTEARNYLGKPVKPTWEFPEDTFIHVPGVADVSVNDLIYKFQDKQIDTKRAQEAISKAAGQITDDINVYEKEQLFHGKVATAIREYLLNELLPAIKQLKALNLKPQEMQDYLLARHAEERNNKMNELNKLDPRTGKERTTPWELQDRASGMSTDKANEYLKNLDPAKKASLEKVAKMFDEMVTGTQKILVDSGADSQTTIDAWNETYDHYVPLFRIEEDFNNGGMGSTGLSKGFNVSGNFSKRAMGSEKEVQDIIGNLIKQRERALIRAEKLTVTKALYGLFLMNPNPNVALPVNPDAIKSKEALIKELEDLGYDNPKEIANNLMEEPKTRYISKGKQVIDKNTGLPTSDTEESVRLKTDNLARFGDNVLTLRINGKNRYIFFNQNNPDAKRMAASLKSLDVESLGTLTSMVSKATRWFASVNTQYNPIFAAVNLIRDVGAAQFNLTTTPLAGKQAQVTAGIYPAMKGIFSVLRAERKGEVGGNSAMEKAFREFREEGGQTGYRDSLARKESEQSIVDEQLKRITTGPNAKKAFKAIFGALSDFNDTLENSIRLSAYIAASKPKSEGGLGLSKQKAAILAKNLTVNFDKKGQLSANINALYAFFNASIQGSARLYQTLKGPKGKAIIGGGVLLGAMQSVLLAAAGFKDDEPPEFVKERNFIIPTPDGNYLSIPYPLGLHILPSVGRLTTEFLISGFKNPSKKVGDLIGVFADGLSPVGSAGLSMQTIAPTVLDPLAALEANKDAFGRPIYKKEQATNPTPGYMRSRESSSEISKQISYFLNLASGGGKYSKGLVSPTADEIDYVAGQVTGGVGRELLKGSQTIKAATTGEDLPAYRVPLLGRFYGETESNAAESARFYNNIIKMADYENEIKGRIKNKEPVAPYLRDNPQARFWQMANTTENQVNALNKQKKEFIEKDLPKERIKRIENQKAVIMKRFNDHIAKFED